MKICLIGEYSEDLEEGMRKIAFHLSKELSKRHDVLSLNIKKIFSKDFWKEIKDFKPQIIHYIPGPSIVSFIIVKALAFYCKGAKTVVSATHPSHFRFSKNIVPFLKPDLILTQSHGSERMFIDLGCKTEFLPSGVDVEKFIPVSKEVKKELRERYDIDEDKFIILHVGSVKEGRGIEIFKNIQTKGDQVIIVGNKSMGVEKQIFRGIKESGCKIWIKYFNNIEEIYVLSDCYIFSTPPMNKTNSIEIPLSIVEAMSCNLPVITTKFEALPRIFKEGNGLIFVNKEEEFIDALKKIKKTDRDIKTREKVLPYAWENIVERLEKIYEKLVFNSKGGDG
ncbi:MAG: Glycosyl transferases group 1 [Candidatus Argoarchaeum ethanivorans]|uniref:Glycosyl transferases group 1 n=1 Tax=Candidatus Argoarchaeum ethanivorans TaxID=2608793 RepID=A0A811T6E2_9EURY|nr:MAG: Glycosyl transferases group 1 [Candidatus Argoarchaeum ethanivorans]